MGADIKTVGGGPATGLAEDWVNVLRYLITGQAPGTATTGGTRITGPGMGGTSVTTAGVTPFNQTSQIMQGLNRLLGGVDLTGTGQAMEQLIQQDISRGSADLRARFGASGGTSAGTPAAVAEALYRSEAAPRGAMALGQLNLQKAQVESGQLIPLLQLIAQMAGMGIPQAGTVAQPNMLSQILGFLPGAAVGAGSVMSGIGALA